MVEVQDVAVVLVPLVETYSTGVEVSVIVVANAVTVVVPAGTYSMMWDGGNQTDFTPVSVTVPPAKVTSSTVEVVQYPAREEEYEPV